MSEFYNNLSMQALSKSNDKIFINFDAINQLNKNLNNLMIGEIHAFEKQKISTMLEDFDWSIFVVNEQTYNKKKKKIKNSIVSDIINNERIDFSTDNNHISLPNSAEEIKQEKINEEEMFLKTGLKKNERDIETFKNLIDETKRDLLKTFTEPDGDLVVHDILNVNDWGNKTKNKLDLDIHKTIKSLPVKLLKQTMQIYCKK